MATPSTPVAEPLPFPLPPHHKAVFKQATMEEDDRGRFIRIPLENTDPNGFERKRRKDWKCKFCRNEKVSLSGWNASVMDLFHQHQRVHLLTFSLVSPGNAVRRKNQVQEELRHLEKSEDKQRGNEEGGAGVERMNSFINIASSVKMTNSNKHCENWCLT